nr:hypothetical protein [Streptomyces sasae]
MRIVRGTRRGGSLDVPLTVAMGIALVVTLTGTVSMALDLALAVPLTGHVPVAGDLPLALVVPLTGVVPLAGALIGRPPVPGRCAGLPGLRSRLRPGVWRRSPG